MKDINSRDRKIAIRMKNKYHTFSSRVVSSYAKLITTITIAVSLLDITPIIVHTNTKILEALFNKKRTPKVTVLID